MNPCVFGALVISAAWYADKSVRGKQTNDVLLIDVVVPQFAIRSRLAGCSLGR